MRLTKVGSGLLAACSLLGVGCSKQDSGPVGSSYGVVTLVDGKVGVVDLQSAKVTATLQPSTRGVVQVATLPESRELYTADPNNDKILHYQFNSDMTQANVIGSFGSPVYVNGLVTDERPGASRDNLVVTSKNALLWKIAVPTTNKPQDSIAVFNLKTGALKGTVKTGSPWRAEVRDNVAYVADVHNRGISVVNLDSMTVTNNLQVGPAQWPNRDNLAVGPINVTTTKDGRYLISSDFEGLSISIFDTQNNFAKTVHGMNGVVYTSTLSPDESKLYVVTYELTMPIDQVMASAQVAGGTWYDGPQPLDEAHNATLNTRVHVLAWPSMKEITSFTPEWAGQKVFFGADASKAFLTTGAGSVLQYDSETLRLRGEAVVGGVGSPVYCGSVGLL